MSTSNTISDEQKKHIKKLSYTPVQYIAEFIGYKPFLTSTTPIWLHKEYPPVLIDGDHWAEPILNQNGVIDHHYNTIDFLKNHCRMTFKEAVSIIENFISLNDPLPEISFHNPTENAPEEFKNLTLPPFYGKIRYQTVLDSKLDNLSMSQVLFELSAEPNQDNNRNKWKVPGVGNLSLDGKKWYDLNGSYGKHGPISLVSYCLKIKHFEAKQWLQEHFEIDITNDDLANVYDFQSNISSHKTRKSKDGFQPPTPNAKNLPFVKKYLHYDRGIPLDLIDDLIAQNILYADDDRNCVFISQGIAEIRSSFDGPNAVKELCPGSSRVKGILIKAKSSESSNTLAICEGTITSISHHSLYPDRSVLSTAGANMDFPLQVAIDSYEKGLKTILAFDNDKPGHKTAQHIFNYFFIRTWIEDRYQKKYHEEIDLSALHDLFVNKKITYILDTHEESSAYLNLAPEHKELIQKANLLFLTNHDQSFLESNEKPPIILLSIKDNELGLPVLENYPLQITETAFKFVMNEFEISRELPPIGNDWNDYLKIINQQKNKSLSI